MSVPHEIQGKRSYSILLSFVACIHNRPRASLSSWVDPLLQAFSPTCMSTTPLLSRHAGRTSQRLPLAGILPQDGATASLWQGSCFTCKVDKMLAVSGLNTRGARGLNTGLKPPLRLRYRTLWLWESNLYYSSWASIRIVWRGFSAVVLWSWICPCPVQSALAWVVVSINLKSTFSEAFEIGVLRIFKGLRSER